MHNDRILCTYFRFELTSLAHVNKLFFGFRPDIHRLLYVLRVDGAPKATHSFAHTCGNDKIIQNLLGNFWIVYNRGH